jgi:hypothetical protein
MEKAKRWLLDLNGFEKLDSESIVKWMIRFADMKCVEEKM